MQVCVFIMILVLMNYDLKILVKSLCLYTKKMLWIIIKLTIIFCYSLMIGKYIIYVVFARDVCKTLLRQIANKNIRKQCQLLWKKINKNIFYQHTLFLIFRLTFFRAFSSLLVRGRSEGMTTPSSTNSNFSSSVKLF